MEPSEPEKEAQWKAGAVLGALAGLPLSYFFQSGYIRGKFSIDQYLYVFFRDFEDAVEAGVHLPVLISMSAFAGIGALIQYLISKR